MKTCPKCNASMQDDVNFCTECGTKMSEPQEQTKFCISCGAKIPYEAQFCPECAAKQVVEEKKKIDLYESIREYREKDIISATINQNVALQMGSAFTLLAKHLITGKRCPKMINTDIALVMKSNVHQYD